MNNNRLKEKMDVQKKDTLAAGIDLDVSDIFSQQSAGR
jgi:hypothetical protein